MRQECRGLTHSHCFTDTNTRLHQSILSGPFGCSRATKLRLQIPPSVSNSRSTDHRDGIPGRESQIALFVGIPTALGRVRSRCEFQLVSSRYVLCRCVPFKPLIPFACVWPYAKTIHFRQFLPSRMKLFYTLHVTERKPAGPEGILEMQSKLKSWL
ncbi:hypothetical protein CPC08DRAFT_318636 [Agrocybe pediades]|nr:hypothetical protein CPC08DRAFT_318636 [Agrocybe pediades]